MIKTNFPNWYGIPNISFIYCGEWSDPEIEYKGKRINLTIVENTMWERFNEECEERNEKPNNNGFESYMKENCDEVYELIELAFNN